MQARPTSARECQGERQMARPVYSADTTGTKQNKTKQSYFRQRNTQSSSPSTQHKSKRKKKKNDDAAAPHPASQPANQASASSQTLTTTSSPTAAPPQARSPTPRHVNSQPFNSPGKP